MERCTDAVFAIVMALLLVGQSSARPQPDEIEDMKKALYSACSGKYPITEEIKTNAKKGELSTDTNFKCFLKCVLSEISLIDDEGNVDQESMVAFAPDDIKPLAEDIVKICLPNIAGKPDSCEVAYNLFSCGTKTNLKMIEFVPLM